MKFFLLNTFLEFSLESWFMDDIRLRSLAEPATCRHESKAIRSSCGRPRIKVVLPRGREKELMVLGFMMLNEFFFIRNA